MKIVNQGRDREVEEGGAARERGRERDREIERGAEADALRHRDT